MKNDDRQQLLSVSQAARFLGMSTDRLRRLARAGVVKHTRTPGGHRRFDQHQLSLLRDGRPRVVVYVKYSVYDTSQKDKLIELTRVCGLEPVFSIQEQEAEVTRELPQRMGFKRIIELVRAGQVDGLIVDSVAMLGGTHVTPWLRALRRLGLTCWVHTSSPSEGEVLAVFP